MHTTLSGNAQSHKQRLQRHINAEALQPLNNDGLVRRLKRTKPFVYYRTEHEQ